MNPSNTKTVVVRNYEKERQHWGNGQGFVALEKITLDWTGRSEPRWHNECDYGDWYRVNTWNRDDGVIDYYEHVIEEAKQNGLNPHLN